MNDVVKIPTALIEDINLSDRARMVYIFLSAYFLDYDFCANDIAVRLHMNVGTLYKYIKELMENGWIERTTVRSRGKVIGASYTLRDEKKGTDTDQGDNT